MALLFSLALRNALRHRRRSLLTSLTVTLGIGLLLLVLSWVHGVMGGAMHGAAHIAGEVRLVRPEFAQKEQLFPLYANVADAEPVVAAVRAVPGVVSVHPRISLPMTLTVGDEIGEHFTLVQGAPIEWFTTIMGIDAHIETGRMMDGDKEIVLGKYAADEAGAKVGDTVYLLGQTQDGGMSGAKMKLVGIADMGNSAQNRISYVTMQKVQDLADIPGGALEILAYGADPDEAGPLAAAVRAIPEAKGLEVQAWNERAPFNGMVKMSGAIQLIFAGAVVFITALGVLNTMLMSVLERTGEIGVLRAMGLGRAQTVMLFVIEAIGIATVGGLLGVTMGGLVAWAWLERVGINLGGAAKSFPSAIPINSIMYGDVTLQHLVIGFLLGLLMAVVGSLIPALRAAGIQPVEAMRSRK